MLKGCYQADFRNLGPVTRSIYHDISRLLLPLRGLEPRPLSQAAELGAGDHTQLSAEGAAREAGVSVNLSSHTNRYTLHNSLLLNWLHSVDRRLGIFLEHRDE